VISRTVDAFAASLFADAGDARPATIRLVLRTTAAAKRTRLIMEARIPHIAQGGEAWLERPGTVVWSE